ncbi:MAG TPA: LysM domain-containing protein [Ottowia sp.]|uniref:LysM peptidoglycan-binding domain-containing protein n=1 Tax=Ottowia sp. TaxID=1898956 RepID=UPI002C630A90|nr:LysM domain-containing protein [Ottowia sp.]HMN21801.1 LysM domain-containing protein [Ottowia sp.]
MLLPLGTLLAAAAALAAPPQHGIHSPVTPTQRATAQQVAAQGVPLSALAPDAPDEYTVRRGDTLWGISGKFLRSAWRWPELWGMNLNDIRNPHLIYPGQQLYLERVGDRAFLRARRTADGQVGGTVRVSPRNRVEMLDANPLPTLATHLIEPFLAEPLVFDDDTFQRAPRIVALSNQDRVLVVSGDRAYARGPDDAPLAKVADAPTDFRVFRAATPLKDPVSGEILGYEGQYVGQVQLVRGESQTAEPGPQPGSEPTVLHVPATIDVLSSKEEMRAGDRLLPEPPREYRNYVPHAPEQTVDARVVSVYGNAVRYAGGNQVVAINKGTRDGMASGDVLALLSTGPRILDKTEGRREALQLPDERNGLGMVFRTFDRVSYVLVMEVTAPVQVGDKLTNPR